MRRKSVDVISLSGNNILRGFMQNTLTVHRFQSKMNNFTSYVEAINKIHPFGWTISDKVEAYEFEKLHPFYWQAFVSNNRNVAFYTVALYIAVIFSVQKWMKDRPPYKLKMPLFFWNLGLGIFSIIGFARIIPGTILILSRNGGFYNSMCAKVGDIPASFWCLMFVFSKYVELGDTIFIVLRKRPLIFLQYYHHALALSSVWLLAPLMEPVQRLLTLLNFGVHLFMYNYFAMRAIGVKVPNFIANFITTLQLAQMFIGLGVNVASAYYYYTGQNCFRHEESIQIFSVVYGSFVILFGKLFYQSVIKKWSKEKVRKVE